MNDEGLPLRRVSRLRAVREEISTVVLININATTRLCFHSAYKAMRVGPSPDGFLTRYSSDTS